MLDRLRSFQDVLAAAIADMAEHGFDSIERIAKWTRELRMAAERSMISPQSLEDQMRQGLAAIYRRMVDQGGIFKYNPGVERFTLENIKPTLRSELDRRIIASANLIKLNRAEAIEKTLRRFQGWSTSIPPGGVSAETRAEVKANVRKSLASLNWEERRVLIDQGHKLTASLSEILATDGGAIAAEWRSNFRQPGYDARPDHVERDGKFYLVRDSWAHQVGFVKKGPNGYYDEHEAVGQLPFCRCYAIWKFSLRDLPTDMLTAKGKAALAGAREQAARADATSEGVYATKAKNMHSNATKGHLASGGGVSEGVAGAQAHKGRARADSADFPHGGSSIPVPVDRDHDVAWMFVVSRNCERLYADRTLPRSITIKGKTFDPAQLGWAHERAEWLHMMRMVAAFLDLYGRHPGDQERVEIYLVSHQFGIAAEHEEADRMGVDWDAWEAWSRGELARLEHRAIRRPPIDPHVKPAPHDRREPMENVAA